MTAALKGVVVPDVEFFFDLSSPWTCLAFRNIQPMLRELDVTARWRPFLVGGVFNAVNDSVYAGRADPNAPKNRHSFSWLKAWARLAGVPMNFPSAHHPLKSVKPMRLCCALEESQADLLRFADAAFAAYFTDQRNLDDPDVLVLIADTIGLDGRALLAESETAEVKDRLRSNTQEAIDRGAFGSPTIFIDQKLMFFGNDQLPIVRQTLEELTA